MAFITKEEQKRVEDFLENQESCVGWNMSASEVNFTAVLLYIYIEYFNTNFTDRFSFTYFQESNGYRIKIIFI